jgi:tripeptide aminopeptidase
LATLPKTPPGLRTRLWDAKRITDLARHSGLSSALRWFARERAWINEQHLQLCRIPAPTFFEQQRASWFRTQLESFGWNARIDRAGNVIATHGSAEEARPIIVSAHLDTVFAPSKAEDIYYASDGRLVGPGSSDNGSGLAGLLAIGKLLGSTLELYELASDVMLVANVGEEGEGNLSGMRYLCQQSGGMEGLRGFVVLDGPSTDHVTAQALASRRYEITFSGPGGHSWNDHGTPNPVHALAEMIGLFVQDAEARISLDRNNPCSFNFGLVEGGTSINSIPASARAKLDIRSEEAAVLSDFATLLTTCVERSLEHGNRKTKNSRLTAKIKEIGSRPGGKLAPASPLLQTVQSVDSYLNIRARVDCASTDANVPLSLGLPAVSIGAGGHGGGAHTNNEWYQPDGRESGLRRILLIIAALHDQKTALEQPPL